MITPGFLPSVSVVMPVYNVDAFLEEAIQSVLQQSLQNIQLILVNDGSTDSSGKICTLYAQADDRVLVLDQSNAGVSVARNRGLEQANGEYVFFMDADDTIDLNFLRSSYQIGKNDDAELIIVGDYFVQQFPRIPALPTCGQMWKVEFLKGHPTIRFPKGIQPGEDGLFSHQLLALNPKVAFNSEAIYYYRQHENQNHKRINADFWKVLRQIPYWFDILKSFYLVHGKTPERMQHLALFIEHEPFQLRYLETHLDAEQKDYLFKLIVAYFEEIGIEGLTLAGRESLTPVFRKFLSAGDYRAFDKYYIRYLKNRSLKRRALFFLSKFIPFSNPRREFRERLRKMYPA
ncbi:glycosyltransferase family 2 protein [Sphingobacterium deserti]|uniref:Glycosyl transferase family 2 n=1 Tax=Sphingobacterium deserti TaxID=1229276 RepID=A0A0B8T0A9_9SPHI|nr:glycosyltransferase [Sphingobacterium deserti]KGE13912.1 glycosyl transferase family 2 [Sphingobacterium deserti]